MEHDPGESSDGAETADTDFDDPGDSALAGDVEFYRRLRQSGLKSLESLGNWFGGPASFGGNAAGRDINVNYTTVPRIVLATGKVDSQRLCQVRASHIPGDSYHKADSKLRTIHLLVLRGTDGSGKRTAALHMMEALTKDHVHVVDGTKILDAQENSWIAEKSGYLADIRETRLTNVGLAALASDLKKHESYLVITTSVETMTDADVESQFVVEHLPPTGHEVLEHRLLQDPGYAGIAKRLLEDASALDCAATPGEGLQLAKLALDAARKGQSADALRPALVGIRRGRARHLLRVGSPKQAERDRTELLYRRATLISMAVFTGLPHADAVEAAESLARKFIEIEFEKQKHELFVPWRKLLLREPDIVPDDSELTGPWGPVNPSRVRFTDPELSSVLLETVWDEFEAVRSPLLTWLRDLAVDRFNEPVRVRAAQIAGRLTALDFGHICHRLILGWATAEANKPREAAVAALDAVPPALRTHASRLISDWCERGTPAQQRTAILALGAGLHGKDPDEILERFRQIALRNTGRTAQLMATTVRRGVTELFSGNHPQAVLRALAQWAGDGNPRLYSLVRRCILPLAYVTGECGEPVLLRVMLGDPAVGENTAATLAAALDEPETRPDAWAALERLVSLVIGRPELEPALGTLLSSLVQRSATTREEIRFYLRFWAHQHPELLRETRPMPMEVRDAG
ncbi:MAG: hypothetical protein J2P25_10965 [Nocardiopsaceae bacterium]|nr:hypothetical protein [Nocardiopsaceae bacterium]